MDTGKKRVFIAGHRGMVGSALLRAFQSVCDVDVVVKTRNELDLTCQESVVRFFADEDIDEVYIAAAKVGGILANNNYPADFIYQNLMIECNLIHSSHLAGIQKILFLGSSCIYPKFADQPIKEEYLLSGKLEVTNEAYAIAKIAGIKLCESYNKQYGRDFRSIMPSNLYGPFDNFHKENSHVVPALIRRIHEAKVIGQSEVVVWGSGKPLREFLYVQDLADAAIYLMNVNCEVYKSCIGGVGHINVGTGKDCTIKYLSTLIADVINYKGSIVFDDSYPDGTPRKLLDITKLTKIGWTPSWKLSDGLKESYSWFLDNKIH